KADITALAPVIGRSPTRDTARASWPQVSGQPKPHAAGAVLRVEVISVVGPHEGRGAEPGPAAQLALGAGCIPARRTVDRRSRIIRVPAILGPLKHVAQHVVESPSVGFERTDGCRVHVAIIAGKCRPPGVAMCRAFVGDVG